LEFARSELIVFEGGAWRVPKIMKNAEIKKKNIF